MFIVALFIITGTWKPPRGPAIDELIKMWYISSYLHQFSKLVSSLQNQFLPTLEALMWPYPKSRDSFSPTPGSLHADQTA